jgi:tRNA threonylcarbamoyladenosine biosynthesis protein TsaB
LILFSTALELTLKSMLIMNNLIIDATKDVIVLTLIINKNIYTCRKENSKINFDKLTIIIEEFLAKNEITLSNIENIYVNRGPGSFAGIRNSLSITKAFFLTKKINYYCFSLLDFEGSKKIKYEDIPDLCDKYNIKKNLINPIYLS